MLVQAVKKMFRSRYGVEYLDALQIRIEAE